MKKREWLSLIMVAMTVVAALLISTQKIFITGVDGDRFFRSETKALLLETAVIFVLAFLILRFVRDRRHRLALLATEAAIVAWMHQAFLPMAVSGLYLAVIIRVGCVIRSLLDRDRQFEEYRVSTALADLALGWITVVLLYCLLSLMGIGSIPATRVAAVMLGAATFLPGIPGTDARRAAKKRLQRWFHEVDTVQWTTAALYAFIFAMVLLQVGRMNICADYDSLHYGLRSEYVLNDGDGIYENLGSVNVVYTYSKGLETLLLPISGLPSYSYFLSFQVWMTVGILLASAEIAKLFASRRCADLCMALLASIPGIMNMGITAKTDAATALFQLIMAYYLLQFVRERRSAYMAVAGNAFLLTMTLKPTSLVFSTVLAGTAFLFFFATKSFRVNPKERFFLSWIPAIAMWLLIWMRTLLITGLPVTSVFTSIWTKLGFTIQYPFRFDSLPSNGGTGLKEALKHFLKRLYGVLLAPVGDDMAHVRIAWGTSLLLIFLVLFLVPLLARMKGVREHERKPLICLVCMFLTNGVMSLVALYLLWQVDGNYFILLYCLFAILACIVIDRIERPFLARSVVGILVPMLVFNVAVTAVSNWSGTLGLSPVRWAHLGYFDHWAEAKDQMEHRGNVEIWDKLAADPQTRVLVYGEQPEMLMFPCNAQSFTDIEGSGGNYHVSASVEGMVDYFEYAETEYVYLCGGYLKPGTQTWNHVVEMIESGYLTDLFYENGHGLARVALEPVRPEHPEEALETFAQCYFAGDQQ